MSDEQIQINIAIAEACGWRELFLDQNSEPWGFNTGLHYSQRIPEYCNDLNAMHEAEKILTTKQKQRYAKALSDDLSDSAPTESCHTVWSDTIHATARQRAKALLKTLEKLDDAK